MRKTGVMTALVDGAIDFARNAKATILEAYPVKTEGIARSISGMYTGTALAFERAGIRHRCNAGSASAHHAARSDEEDAA